MLTVQVIVEDV